MTFGQIPRARKASVWTIRLFHGRMTNDGFTRTVDHLACAAT